MKPLRARIAMGALLAAWLLTTGIAFWQARRASLAEERSQAAARELARLRGQAPQAAVPSETAEPAAAGSARGERSGSARRDTELGGLVARREAEIETLQSELSEARAETNRLRLRVDAFDEDLRKSADAANTRYATAQAEWQSRLESLTEQVETAQSAAEVARARSTALEASLARQTADQTASQAKLVEARRLLTSLQDLNRRRNTYLDSVLRRYRDVLGQLRAIGNVMDASRDQNASVVSSSALARIESTISLAEDDLRQLSDVNSRAAQTEKQLSQMK